MSQPPELDSVQLIVSAADLSKYSVLKSLAAPSSSGAAAPSATSTPAAAATADPAVPAPYYWEAGGDGARAPLPTVVVHNLHWVFARTLGGIEYAGDFFSELFGLYNSRYEWAMDLEQRNIAAAEENELLEERRKRWEEIAVLNRNARASGAPAAGAPAAGASVPGASAPGASAAGTGLGQAAAAAADPEVPAPQQATATRAPTAASPLGAVV